MRSLSELELGWIAGIFEGEGTLVQVSKRSWSAKVQMTDKDIIERFATITGLGRVKGPYITQSGRKPQYNWVLAKWPDLKEFLEVIRPHMGERRGQRIDEALTSEPPGLWNPDKTVCPKCDGEYTVKSSGKRYCKPCRNKRLRKQYAEIKEAGGVPYQLQYYRDHA